MNFFIRKLYTIVRSLHTIYKLPIFNVKVTKLDYFFITLPLLLILLVIGVWFLNILTYEYYPTLSPIKITWNYIVLGGILILMVVSLAIFSPLKKVIDLD